MQEELTYIVEGMLLITLMGSAILAVYVVIAVGSMRYCWAQYALPMPEIKNLAAASVRSQRFTAVQ